MKTLTIKRTTSLTGFSASAIRLALATLCVILMMSAARAQETRPTEPAPNAQPQSGEQRPADKDAPPPADGLLQLGEQTTEANQVVDGDFVFTSPGVPLYTRDIRLSDNIGGLRFFGTDALATSPQGAAIQFFGNSAASFGGQLFLDSGALNSAALIFRTAPTNGTITERMRIASNGNVGIGTTGTTFARLNVVAAGFGGAINAFTPDGTSITGQSTTSRGVAGFSSSGIGVLGNSLGGIGVRGSTNSTAGLAGQFDGNVQILGNLTKSSGSFKIDHPLDPANKYLSHSFVESPDMMNIYNGNATLSAKGEAVVTMPAWFDALNKDFRYQLTALGAPGPDLYVAEEIKGNRFKIAGGRAGMKVSWQVTGVRRDAYAEAHRVPVEEDKPAKERGTYLNPEAFGQPKQKGVANVQLTEEARQSKEGRAESGPQSAPRP